MARVETSPISDQIATPSTRLTTAVAAFCDTGAVVLNGNTTATTVASPMIQPKKTRGYGVETSSRYISAVAASATAAAANTYPTVDASPQAPAFCGARIGMLNSHRQTRMPTRAIRPATTAVATPPDHSCLASTRRWVSSSGSGGSGPRIGIVIGSPYVKQPEPSQAYPPLCKPYRPARR